jgi:hypothetical protein
LPAEHVLHRPRSPTRLSRLRYGSPLVKAKPRRASLPRGMTSVRAPQAPYALSPTHACIIDAYLLGVPYHTSMSKERDSQKRIAFVQLFAEASASKDLPDEIHVLPTGKWSHPIYGEMEITSAHVSEFIQNFKDKVRKDLPITAGHDDNGMSGGELPAVPSRGWLESKHPLKAAGASESDAAMIRRRDQSGPRRANSRAAGLPDR